MNLKSTGKRVEVTADGEGLTSHSDAYLLTELADQIPPLGPGSRNGI